MGSEEAQVVILGGGLTGISAAMHLKQRYLLVEKNDRLGGHARTDQRDGYYFDKTGHWLHLRDPYTQGLIERLVGDKMTRVARKAHIFANGCHTRYPFQANLYGQPPEVVKECLLGFIDAWHKRPEEGHRPANFEEFIFETCGEGIAKHFMIPYNHKLWGVHPREITADWCTRFVPRPKLDAVVAGAVGANEQEMGYNISFLYPKTGGIETMTKALISEINPDQGRIALGATPDEIDVETNTVTVGGEKVPYKAMVATIPLPVLMQKIKGLPADVEKAASQLRCTLVRYLNVATKSPSPLDTHWFYVPEEKYNFYRVGVYSNAVPTMAKGSGASLYVELSERGETPTGAAKDDVIRHAAQGLADAQVIASADDLLFADMKELKYAYVVFDDNYYPATEKIRSWLESKNIFPRGRYGFWTYNSMEDCILAGKEAAETIDAKL